MTWPFGDLIPLRYGAILADPPWNFENWSEKGEAKNPSKHYACMPIDEIAALPVNMLAQRDCLLVMWATAPMLPQAFRVMDAWGFRYLTAGGWAKRSKRDTSWHFGTGYVQRSALEFYLIGAVGEPRYRKRSRNLIVAPIRQHSRKPDEMHDRIEALVDGPYVELFARARRPAWAAWGHEVDKFEGAPNDKAA